MLTVEDHAECKAKISVFENLVTRYPVTVEQDEKNQTDAKEYLVIHGERHKLIITVSKKIGTFHIQKEAHTSYGAKDQLINRISWELLVDGEMKCRLCDEDDASLNVSDCKRIKMRNCFAVSKHQND